ncbi:MAG: acyl-CoA dehydrogenase [Acidobacteria bacterium RIFCSPLOWO2_02_FULL_61_28]|nr:MAG: acyl-CoA dehydrogenase [Acidobacteria bacterium RIFCSPLOWO2_02_FULL_61_28]
MELELTGEQGQVRHAVREFAESEIAPHVKEWDQNAIFPTEIIPRLSALGLLGIIFPEQYGGGGLGYVEYVTAIEELARVDGSIALTVAAHTSLCTNHIFLSGTEAQRQKYVPSLASGKKLGCWSLTEPEAGSDAGGTRTRAERSHPGWVLNGIKTFTTNGSYADVCVAMAVTNAALGHHGISAFIIEKGTPGFRPGHKEQKLGMCASDTAEVIFEDCRIPQENLLGEEGHGFIDSLKVLDGGRISIAALSVGIAQGAFDAALRYSQQRRQFGRPISDFQGIQWKLADMATEIEAARLLTYQAARRKDQGHPVTREASMAKLFASEVAVRVTGEALQIHGGYGFLKDYPVEKFYRDARLCTIGEGTSEIQRLVIARSLLDSHG